MNNSGCGTLAEKRSIPALFSKIPRRRHVRKGALGMIRSGSPRSFDWTDPDETPLFAVFPSFFPKDLQRHQRESMGVSFAHAS
jgi:hypothetical protein